MHVHILYMHMHISDADSRREIVTFYHFWFFCFKSSQHMWGTCVQSLSVWKLVEVSQNSVCPHGPKSHEHASRRGNLLENFHSYTCTKLLIEWYSVQRNNTAAIPTTSGRLRVYTQLATQVFWVSCRGTKVSPLESLPSIKHIWEATLKLPQSWWLSVESAGRFTSFLASFSANPRLLHPITSRQVYKTMEQ